MHFVMRQVLAAVLVVILVVACTFGLVKIRATNCKPTEVNAGDDKQQAQTYLCRATTPEILPTWLMFIVSGGGILFALQSLTVLTEQTNATKDAAIAAKNSANTLVAAEAAFLKVEIEQSSPHGTVLEGQMTTPEGARVTPTQVNYKITATNLGRTPAFVSTVRAKLKVYEAIPRSPELELCEFLKAEPEIVAPHEKPKAITTYSHTSESRHGGQHFRILVLYGFVEFIDIFGRRRHARFGYSVTPESETMFRRLMGYQWNSNDDAEEK